MSKKLLKCLWVLLIGLVVLVTIALIIGHRPKEESEIETIPEETVQAVIEEETSEKETAVIDAAAVAPDRVVAATEPETEVPSYTVEELADYVLNAGLNGADREAYLGERYEEVQAWIDANYQPPAHTYAQTYDEPSYYVPSGGGLNPYDGINYYYGTLETYYNMDMSGVVDWMHSLGYGGEYWVRGDGVKMLGNYVMVAADYDWMPKGSIVETSLGTGIVCDTGLGGWYWYDIAVDW